MQLFCPACDAAFTGAARCPRCGGLLLPPDEGGYDPAARPAPPPAHLRLSPGGRVVVGTVAALGLYLGLRELTTGWVLAAAADPAGWWLTPGGLAAAGRGRGGSVGGAVGGACGGLFLAAEVAAGTPPGQAVLYLQPALLVVGGCASGAAGAKVWAAVPELELPAPVTKKLSSIRLETVAEIDPGRPTAWARVLLGAAVMVAGVGLAEEVRTKAQRFSGGMLRVESRGQARFISWQVATLAILAGGAVAAAGTGAGLRHGLFAGALGAAGVVGLTLARGELDPPVAYLLDKLEIGTADPAARPVLLVGAGAVLATGLFGGWLAGQLFVPLAPPHMRNRSLRVGA